MHIHYEGKWEGGWALEFESFLGPVKWRLILVPHTCCPLDAEGNGDEGFDEDGDLPLGIPFSSDQPMGIPDRFIFAPSIETADPEEEGGTEMAPPAASEHTPDSVMPELMAAATGEVVVVPATTMKEETTPAVTTPATTTTAPTTTTTQSTTTREDCTTKSCGRS